MRSDPFFVSAARWVFVALGVAIPLSTALDNLLLFILLAALAGHYRAVWQTIAQNAVARASAVLFAALVLGLAYGNTPLKEAASILGKYIDLAFVPLLMVAARDANTRHRAASCFLAIMLVTALLSWLVGLRILPVAEWMWAGCTPDNPAIFRSSITQNILMVYAAYLLALRARESVTPNARWLTVGMAVLAASNVLFMVQGKTGYLILLALLVYFVRQWMARRRHASNAGWKKTAGMGLLALMLVIGIYQISPRLQERVDEMVTDIKVWQPNAGNETSTGERLDFYYNTIELVKQHPLLGVGTGGFAAAYAQQVRGTGVEPTRNPHNEYLMIMVQLGVAGLALLLYLFYTQWRATARLPSLFEQDAAHGLVLTITITALFNSPLLDHTEGLFFAFMSAMLFTKLDTRKQHV